LIAGGKEKTGGTAMNEHRPQWSYAFQESLSAEEYARRQGVHPVSNFSALLGAGKAEDWDGFDEALEQWRKGNADKRRSALDEIAKKAHDLGLY
jgi:hypothetical protein